MKTKINNLTGKGKSLNTKLLAAILAMVILGIGIMIAMPGIQESRHQAKQRAAAEEMYGKDFDKPETYMPQARQPKPGGLGNVNRR